MNGNTTKISKGFTLIELLVVIAIIALLLAILGPSLGKAKLQVQDTVCRSNMKQWSLVYALYANDNEDSYPQSIAGNGVTAEDAYFLGALLPYYEDLAMRDCPVTKSLNRLPVSPDAATTNMGGTFTMWGPFTPSINKSQWWDTYAEGSYAFNDWVADPPPGEDTFWGMESSWAVRTTFEKGASRIPTVYDSVWIDTAPRMNNNAPSNAEHEMDQYSATWWTHAMKFICIDRHKGGINMSFVDMDVRHVDIKELWQLKWHMVWIKCNPSGGWPTWTDKYKDHPL